MSNGLIDQFTEHEALSVSRFLDQFKNAEDLKEYAKSYAEQIQELENATFEVILERVLDAAVGVQLEAIGAIVGQGRTTSDDTEYRIAIKAKIAINLSDGTMVDLIKILGLILETSGEAFKFWDEPPAQVRVIVIDPLTITPSLVHSLLESADPGGVRLLLAWTPALLADRLIFSDQGGGIVDGSGVFSDQLGGTTGNGFFGSVVE